MTSKFLKIIPAIIVFVFISVGYLFLSGKTGQTKKNIDNIATENVFCGKNYTTEILKIKDIDVVKRIIEIWKEKEGECEFYFEGKNIGVAKKVSADGKIYNVVIYDKDDKEQSQDPFNQSVEQFEINLNDNTISYQLQLEGSFFEIGKFK